MRDRFTSAYTAYNGREPEYTCPTPLARRGWRRKLRQTWLNWKAHRTLRPWRGTLDYIFVSAHWQVKTCQLILTQPQERDRTIYPSDHFGLAAKLHLNPISMIDERQMTNNP